MSAKTYGCPMKMPWTVKLAMGWFIALALIVVGMSGWSVVRECSKGGMFLRAEIIQATVSCAGVAALGVGFAMALAKGRRAWVEIPYALIGGMAFLLPLGAGILSRDCRTVYHIVYLILEAFATIFPIVLINLPSASRWMAYVHPRRKPGMGCLSAALLAVLCLFVPPFTFDVNPARRIAAHTSAQAMRGRKLFVTIVTNNLETAWAVPADCSNSVEYIERLRATLGERDDPYLEIAGSQWSFAVNVPTNAPDTFPVMITANVTPEIVPRSWDGKSGRDDVLDLVPLMSENPLPKIGYDAIVVIRKCGAAQVLKKRYIKRRNLFLAEPYDLGEDTYYLTPTGRVYPK